MPEIYGNDYIRIDFNGTNHRLKDTVGRALTVVAESSSTASAAHKKGEYFEYSGTLYIATANIASGGTITPGTNCEAKPSGLGGEVSDLTSAIFDDAVIEHIQADIVEGYYKVDSADNVSLSVDSNYYTVRTDISNYAPGSTLKAWTSTGSNMGLIIDDGNGHGIAYIVGRNAADYGYNNTTTPQYMEIQIPIGAKYVYNTIRTAYYTGLSQFDITIIVNKPEAEIYKINSNTAVIEKNNTASTPHPTGSNFLLGGTLYVATSDIAQGGTITVGTNCERDTIGAELYNLKSADSELAEDIDAIQDDLQGVVQHGIGRNLVDPGALSHGGLKNDGTLNTGDSWLNYFTSDFIAVTANTTYVLAQFHGASIVSSRLIYMLYTAAKAPISNTFVNDATHKVIEITPAADGYIRVCSATSGDSGATQNGYMQLEIKSGSTLFPDTYNAYEYAKTYNSNDVLFRKKWAVCGDSFTFGDFTNAVGSYTIPDGHYAGQYAVYPYLIGNRANMDIVMLARGGKTLATPQDGTFHNAFTDTNSGTYNALFYNYTDIPDDADYITLYFGINDSSHASGSSQDGEDVTGHIPLGDITDTTIYSFAGAYNFVINWLLANRPNARIGIIVSNGCVNDNYRTMTIAIAEKWGIPYIDLNGDSRIPMMIRSTNANKSADAKAYALERFAVNAAASNTHPNVLAHKIESEIIEAFLRTL